MRSGRATPLSKECSAPTRENFPQTRKFPPQYPSSGVRGASAAAGSHCHDTCISALERMSRRTGYRIMELPPGSSNLEADGVEVGRYDSAYHAMEDMRRECIRSDSPPPNWYLLAPNEQVLLNPIDLLEMLA